MRMRASSTRLLAFWAEAVSGGGIHIWHKGYGISITGDGITIGIGDGKARTLWFE